MRSHVRFKKRWKDRSTHHCSEVFELVVEYLVLLFDCRMLIGQFGYLAVSHLQQVGDVGVAGLSGRGHGGRISRRNDAVYLHTLPAERDVLLSST